MKNPLFAIAHETVDPRTHRVLKGDITYANAPDARTAERRKWLSYGPALVNTIVGREVFPQSTADTALVETFADNLDEEQIQKLAEVVPPELWGPPFDETREPPKVKTTGR